MLLIVSSMNCFDPEGVLNWIKIQKLLVNKQLVDQNSGILAKTL
jgi:hypothetical protein